MNSWKASWKEIPFCLRVSIMLESVVSKKTVRKVSSKVILLEKRAHDFAWSHFLARLSIIS